jgi:hypothetical protein
MTIEANALLKKQDALEKVAKAAKENIMASSAGAKKGIAAGGVLNKYSQSAAQDGKSQEHIDAVSNIVRHSSVASMT